MKNILERAKQEGRSLAVLDTREETRPIFCMLHADLPKLGGSLNMQSRRTAVWKQPFFIIKIYDKTVEEVIINLK